MTDDDILEIGTMLEEKGLSHAEIDSYFEHHGVKGQKWGIRNAKQRRIARQQKIIDSDKRVAKGTGSALDKTRAALQISGLDVARGKGLQGGVKPKACPSKGRFRRRSRKAS